MISFYIKAILKIICSAAACFVLGVLAILLLIFQNFSLGAIIGTVTLVAFGIIPVFIIKEAKDYLSKLVYRKGNKEFVSHPYEDDRKGKLEKARFAQKTVCEFYNVFNTVANQMVVALPELPGLCMAEEELNKTPVQIKLCTFDSLQDKDRPNVKIRGDQRANILRVQWIPEDPHVTALLLSHEIGHLVFSLTYPRMTTTDQHQYLCIAKL